MPKTSVSESADLHTRPLAKAEETSASSQHSDKSYLKEAQQEQPNPSIGQRVSRDSAG
jgi:hypothetical protein